MGTLILAEQYFINIFLQEAETKAKSMEQEIGRLHKRLEERNEQLQASASTVEKVLSMS